MPFEAENGKIKTAALVARNISYSTEIMDLQNLTPMMKQYREIKQKFKDSILLFRLGDFYEMFGEDAKVGSKILDIVLTARYKDEKRIPMCGIPFHAAENYLAKLTRAGKKVAICEQVSDPSLPGLVKREVIRVITPGTTFNPNLLENKANNFLISLYPKEDYFGLSYVDVTTGEFKVTEIQGLENLRTEIFRLQPVECILLPKFLEKPELKNFLKQFEFLNLYPFENYDNSYQVLLEHFKVKTLAGFGIEKLPFGIQAAGLLFSYLKETQKTDLKHLTRIQAYSPGQFMILDEATISNLELIRTLRDGSKEGSLLSVLDQTLTAMGGRLLKNWILHPLLAKKEIEERLLSVQELFKDADLRNPLEEILKKILDWERILGRLSLESGNARDLVGLKNSLYLIPEIKNFLKKTKSPWLKKIFKELEPLPKLVELLEKSIEDDPPLTLKEGGLIKEGFNRELDDLKKISREGKTFIKNLQKKEIKRTGIQSLKVRFNQVFGYYIEVSKTNLSRVPEDYIRKQTLVNAERFITPELKEYEEKVLTAEEKIMALEYAIFKEIRSEVLEEIRPIQKNAGLLAVLDVLLNFAKIALRNRYVKPEITLKNKIEIKKGRHPVVEQMTFAQEFVPNDAYLDPEKQNIILLTGPNMAGKSVFLRQIALITLLAQIGSFVPAEKAEIGLIDRIFTRIGASDSLVGGRSTFMVEMEETANILNNATEKSLLILDEVGRGTSTYDGVSIAWAVLEFIHDKIRAKTLFATHYHELIAVAEKLPRASNLSLAVQEDRERGIIFLYRVIPGGIDKSYGLEVAKLAGLPSEVVTKAQQILKDLEEEVVEEGIKAKLKSGRGRISEDQLDLFRDLPRLYALERKKGELTHPALEALKKIDIERLTPLQALQKLDELKKLNQI